MKVNPWQVDKRWSDRFLPEIKSVLGTHLIAEPPVEEDAKRNTDLMVLKMDAVRVGCRVRKNKYLNRFGNEFTIRSGRPSGSKTELTKIIEGWGDYFFYGFCDETETYLAQWVLGDLKAFRIWHSRYMYNHKGKMPGSENPNEDKSSHFRAFQMDDIPDFVIASKRLSDFSNQYAVGT